MNISDLYKILKEAGRIELYDQIIELQEKSLETQKKVIGLENENRELKEKFRIKEILEFSNNVYWTKIDNNKDGPFCPRCWDKNKDLIRLQPSINQQWLCPECKNRYNRPSEQNY